MVGTTGTAPQYPQSTTVLKEPGLVYLIHGLTISLGIMILFNSITLLMRGLIDDPEMGPYISMFFLVGFYGVFLFTMLYYDYRDVYKWSNGQPAIKIPLKMVRSLTGKDLTHEQTHPLVITLDIACLWIPYFFYVMIFLWTLIGTAAGNSAGSFSTPFTWITVVCFSVPIILLLLVMVKLAIKGCFTGEPEEDTRDPVATVATTGASV